MLHRFSAHSGCIHALSVVPLWRSEGRTRHSSSSSCLDNSQEEEEEEQDVAKSGGPKGGDARSGEEGEGDVGRCSDMVATEHVGAGPPPAVAASPPPAGAPERDHPRSPGVAPLSHGYAGRRSSPVAYVVVTSGEDGTAKVWSYGPWEAADGATAATAVATTAADVVATVAGTAAEAATTGGMISIPGPLVPAPTPPLLAGQPPRLVCTARMPQPQGQQQQQHKGKKQGGGGGGVWARPWTTSCVLPIGLAGRNNSGGDSGGTGSLWVAAAGTTGGIAVFQIMPGEC